MGIFRTVPINWEGKEYQFTPNLGLLQMLETGNPPLRPRLSLTKLTADARRGEPQLSLMVIVIEFVLKAAGIENVTQEDLYQEIQAGNQEGVISLWYQIEAAITPQPKEAKKAAAQDSK